MNVLYSSDENYVKYAMVSICSLLENNKELDAINIYFICNSISETSKNKLQQIIHGFNRKLIFIDKDEIDISFIKQSEFSRSGYYRLFASDVIKEDRVLYIDCDTVILDSLKDLWETDIDGYILAGVRDTVEDFNAGAVGLRDNSEYINSGMMLYNLKKMREIHFTEQVIDCFHLYNGYVPHHDQGVVNYIARGKILYLPVRYNLMSQYLLFTPEQLKKLFHIRKLYSDEEVDYAKKHPAIVHFLNKFYGRPWEEGCENPFRKQFLAYSEKYEINIEMSKKIITSKSRRVELRKNAYRHLPFAAFYLIETILYYHRKSAFRKAYAVVNFDEKKDSHENTNY